MEFGLFDHMDRNDNPDAQLYQSRMETILAAEAAGFSSYHLAEHHFTPLGLAPSPSVFLSAVAFATSKIRLGPLVYLLPIYHPLRLIEEICMLDQMSNGRLDLGVGAGVSPFEVGHYGVGDEKPELFRETLDVVIKGLTNDKLNHKGQHHTFENVPMILKTLQKPVPPMWAGAGSEAGMEYSARHGFNVVGLGPTPRIAAITKFYRQAWEQHRGDPMRAHTSAQQPKIGALRQIYIADTDEQAWREAEPAYKFWFDNLQWLWREHDTMAPANLSGDLPDGVAKGAVFAGSPDTIRKAIAKERDATGYNYLALQFAFGTLSNEQVKHSIDLFAKEVMPAFND